MASQQHVGGAHEVSVSSIVEGRVPYVQHRYSMGVTAACTTVAYTVETFRRHVEAGHMSMSMSMYTTERRPGGAAAHASGQVLRGRGSGCGRGAAALVGTLLSWLAV